MAGINRFLRHLAKGFRLTRAEATATIRRALSAANASGTSPALRPSAERVHPLMRNPSAPQPEPANERFPRERFLSGSHSNHAGTRGYRLYVPVTYQGQPRPLVVMLHGCSQDPEDFAAGTEMNSLAEEYACVVLYPCQPQTANHSKCWNWFRTQDQARGQGEPAIIAGMAREILSTYHLDPARVYVAGMSAGGAMAIILGRTYPDLFAAVGAHSALPYGAAADLPSAMTAMRHGRRGRPAPAEVGACPTVPTIVFHGDKDATVHPGNGMHIVASIVAKNGAARGEYETTVHSGTAPGGHAYTRSVYRDAAGCTLAEHWLVHGVAHAWSGGNPRGSFTDPLGPHATREMMRFFQQHRRGH